MIFDAQGSLPVAATTPSPSTVNITGVAGTGQVGTLGKTVSITPTGVSATGQVGTTSDTVTITIPGVSGTGQVGTAVAQVSVTPTGVSATGQVGTLTTPFVVFISSVSGTGQVGGAISSPSLVLAAVAARGLVGDLLASNTVGSGIYVPENYYKQLKGQNLAKETERVAKLRADSDDLQSIKKLTKNALRGIPEVTPPKDPEADAIEVLLLSI